MTIKEFFEYTTALIRDGEDLYGNLAQMQHWLQKLMLDEGLNKYDTISLRYCKNQTEVEAELRKNT